MNKIIFILLLLSNCSYYQKQKFKKLSTENFYDLHFKIEKSSKVPERITTIKTEKHEDFLSEIISISAKYKNKKPAHYIKFSTTDYYLVDDYFLIDLATKKSCGILVFNNLVGVESIILNKNLKDKKENKKIGTNLFHAVFICETTEQ
jgi:hypothetical protein